MCSRFHTIEPYILWVCILLAVLLLSKKIINYIIVPYRCVPVLSNKVPGRELAEVIQKEEFVMLEELQDSLLYKVVLVSENWFCIRNHYIPRNGIAAMWVERESRGFGGGANTYYHLWVILITGEYYHIKVLAVYGYIEIKEMLMRVLQERTIGIGMEPHYGNKKDFLKYACAVKKESEGHGNESSLLELIINKNEVQQIVIQKVLQEREKVTPANKKCDLWTEIWQQEEQLRRKSDNRRSKEKQKRRKKGKLK